MSEKDSTIENQNASDTDAQSTALLQSPVVSEQVILKPPAGQQTTIRITEQKVKLDFDLADVQIDVVDVDVIFTFPDGAKIVLLEAGLDLVSKLEMQFTFRGQSISSQELLAVVGQVSATDIIEIDFSSQAEIAGNADKSTEKPEVQVVEIPVEVIVEVEAPSTAELVNINNFSFSISYFFG